VKALIIGGTGPTGPHLIDGLVDRGYEVTIFHRGVHEPPGLDQIEHIHGDPHFKETVSDALGSSDFDIVLAMYGRVRFIAEVLADRCAHFVAVGGAPTYAGYNEPRLVRPFGLPNPVREDARLSPSLDEDEMPSIRFGKLMAQTEQIVFDFHPRATYFRYPVIYGPRNPAPWEWSVIKRVQDRRPFMILPDNGMSIHCRAAAKNAAAMVLAALDKPDAAAGRVYNVADELQFTLRQWVEVILDVLEADLELIGIPSEIAKEAHAALMPMMTPLSPHSIFDTTLARTELGYRDVVDPFSALAESVRWYADHPVDLETVNPSYTDRFHYDTEDRLVEAYRKAVVAVAAAVDQWLPEALHGMPHPKEPGLRTADNKGR